MLALTIVLSAPAVPAHASAFGAVETLRVSQVPVCEAAQLTSRPSHARLQIAPSRGVDASAAASVAWLDAIARAGLSDPAVPAPVDRPLRSARSSSPDRAP